METDCYKGPASLGCHRLQGRPNPTFCRHSPLLCQATGHPGELLETSPLAQSPGHLLLLSPIRLGEQSPRQFFLPQHRTFPLPFSGSNSSDFIFTDAESSF